MLGEIIREARLAAGLSQEQLAAHARLSRNFISLVERGAQSPTVDTLLRIAQPLGLPAAVLVARMEKRQGKPASFAPKHAKASVARKSRRAR